MLERLEWGMEVEVLTVGLRGVVVQEYNKGAAGQVRTVSGAVFTVEAEECAPIGEPLNSLDRIFCEAGRVKALGPTEGLPQNAQKPAAGENL